MAGISTNVAGRAYWLWHLIVPAVAFFVVAALLATSDVDIAITRAWAYDSLADRFIGSGPGNWWANELIHSNGSLAIRLLGLALVLGMALTLMVPRLRSWRRPARYLLLAGGLAIGSVGLLRAVSNVDCPWSLAAFTGTKPYVHLFSDRPDDLPRARCFPGGHSSSGFALFAFYFLYAGRNTRAAYLGLGVALTVGGLFAFGQEARGAHFLSHDLWSAALAWFSCLAVYWGGFGGDPWVRPLPN